MHQGKVSLSASQTKLKVSGSAVLVETDIAGKSISGCALPNAGPPPPITVTCLTVASELPGGTALKLKVNGKAVLLSNANGLTSGGTNGVPATWSVQDAGQTKLQTS